MAAKTRIEPLSNGQSGVPRASSNDGGPELGEVAHQRSRSNQPSEQPRLSLSEPPNRSTFHKLVADLVAEYNQRELEVKELQSRVLDAGEEIVRLRRRDGHDDSKDLSAKKVTRNDSDSIIGVEDAKALADQKPEEKRDKAQQAQRPRKLDKLDHRPEKLEDSIPGMMHDPSSLEKSDKEGGLQTSPDDSPETPPAKKDEAQGSTKGGGFSSFTSKEKTKNAVDGGDGARNSRAKNFVTHVCWQNELISTPSAARISSGGAAGPLIPHDNDEGVGYVVARSYDGFMRHFISYPGNPYKVAWDVFGGALVWFDLINIPLQAFSPPRVPFAIFMDWFTLLFWTFNMMLEPFTGFVKQGVAVVHPGAILWHYVTGWFLIDLLAVGPDWTFSIAAMMAPEGAEPSSAGDSVRLVRILRLVRMVRLLRLLKLKKVLTNVSDMIDSEKISILTNIVKMIVALLMINHIIACVWFLIASQREEGNWLSKFGYNDDVWTYQYATSFHWSLTQFTPASMDVQPQNMEERVFAVLVVVFALVGFSYLVGSITGSLTQLRLMSENSSREFWNLRRYLKQHNVPKVLSLRVQKYLEHAWARQTTVLSMNDIKIFGLLSEQLHNELQSAMCLPSLSVHPMFKHLSNVSCTTIHRLVQQAISRKQVAVNDNLFYPDECATHMYIVTLGRLRYIKTDPELGDLSESVDSNEDWISEPVLWTPTWIHMGQLMALRESELIMMEWKKFGQVMSLNPQVLQMACQYAKNFLTWLCSVDVRELSDISQGEDVSDMVRQFLGLKGGMASDTERGGTWGCVVPHHP